MSVQTPTGDQRQLLDVFGNIQPEWNHDITYPSTESVEYTFQQYPEVILTTMTGSTTIEVAVRAVITTDPQRFHGYVVTTTHPQAAVVTPDCLEQRLTALTHEELINTGVTTTCHEDISPRSNDAADMAVSLSAALTLATYYTATLDIDQAAVEENSHGVAPASND